MIRSRLVGKEFNDGREDGIFAATPPLEALKLIISDAATGGPGEKSIMINDVARAFLEAPMRRMVCVEIPEEDRTPEDDRMANVALLNMSLYGTRDAASNFQEEVGKFMRANGFIRGKYNASTYYHPEKDIKDLVHGDHFVSSGRGKDLLWLKGKLQGRFEIKTKVIGLGQGESREERVLNRVISVGPEGWQYEPDQRHAELIIRGLGLEGAHSVKTPGEAPKPWMEKEDEEKVTGREVTMFRALAARAYYLAADRSDIQYATKEICRGMAAPMRMTWEN